MANAVQLNEVPATSMEMITPNEMLNRALTSGASIEVMERLMEMSAKWDAMQARKAFDSAMAQLRENMPTVLKTQVVDFTTNKGRTHYKYEDLSAVTEALSPVMAGLGLSFRWKTDSKSGVTVTCIISHRDGHSEEVTLSAGVDGTGNKNQIQAIGSAVTYLQRYTLKAAVGIAAAHDDDAQIVTKNKQAQQTNPTLPKASSRDEFEHIIETIRGASSEQELREYWSTKPWAGMPKDWVGEISDGKNAKLDELNRTPSQTVSAQNSLNDQFPGDLPAEGIEAARNMRAG